MILAGVMFLLGGLANSIYGGVRQPVSPLDDPNGGTGELGQGFAPLNVPEVPDLPANAPTVEGENLAATPTAAAIADPQETPETPAPTPTPQGYVPDRIVIPAIDLDAPVHLARIRMIKYEGQIYNQWVAPNEFAAGWHEASAMLGLPGNTVLNGHHNVDGKVFGHLIDLKEGDLITVYSGDESFLYRVKLKMTLRELNQPIEVRYENARWIMPSEDERLTLVTCWPETGNSHRLIIVAFPVEVE
jgi:sortase A